VAAFGRQRSQDVGGTTVALMNRQTPWVKAFSLASRVISQPELQEGWTS